MSDGFASLTSGLLARKGQARPAMRPQGFATPASALEDLGWNDMGHEPPRPVSVRLPAHLSGAPTFVPPVVRQREELAAAIEAEPTPPPVPEPAPPVAAVEAQPVEAEPVEAEPAVSLPVEPAVAPRSGRKAAFTLRLDAERHLRLRLACAVQNRSAQQLVIEALDALLGDMPDVDRLALSLPAAKN